MFSGPLAGAFLARYCHWDDIMAMEMVQSSILSQLETNIRHSPNYYAPKVWNIADKKAQTYEHKREVRDSTC